MKNLSLSYALLIIFTAFGLGCTKFSTSNSDLATSTQAQGTLLLKGTYQEYIAEDHDGGGTIYGSVEDENHNVYQFLKSSAPMKDLIGVAPGDQVQVEVVRNSKVVQFIQAAQTKKYSQIKIQILALKKVAANSKVVLKQDFETTGEVDFTVAFVYIDYSDYKAAEIYAKLPEDVKRILTGSTWNSIRLHTTEDDVYRLQLNSPYPGCDHWNEMGGAAIEYVNRKLKKNYNRVVAIVPSEDPQNTCTWGGITNGGQSYAMIYPSPIVSRTSSNNVVAHEIGHSLGLGHSAGPSQVGNYGDYQDVMGKGIALNVAKLIDLKVLKEGTGLATIQPGTNTYTIHGRATNIFETQNNIAYSLGGNLISLTENYGLTIHTRTGYGANGNDPSSHEIAKLLPGDVWESYDHQYKVQFIKWDLEANTGIFKVNAPTEDSGGYVGGCIVHEMGPPTVSLYDRYTDSDSGFVEFSTYRFSNVGDCGVEEFVVDVIPISDNVTTISQFKIVQDIKTATAFKFTFPYKKNPSSSEFSIKTRVTYKGKLLNEKVTKLAPYTCSGSAFQSCTSKAACNIPAVTSTVLDTKTTGNQKTHEGYMVVTNPNAESCATAKYEIKLTDGSPSTSNSTLAAEDIEFGKLLTNADFDQNYFIKKNLFLKPGESVKIPLKIKIDSGNQNSLLRIYTIGLLPVRTFTGIDIAWSNIYAGVTNNFSYSSALTPHPHQPVDLTAFNVTGQESELKPSCQVDTYIDDQFKNVSQVDIENGGALRLRIQSKNATSVEYNCNNSTWTKFVLSPQNEFIAENLQNNLSCKLRAVRVDSGKTQTIDCAPQSMLNINIVKKDKVTCTADALTQLANYSMTAEMQVADSNKRQSGYRYILAKAADNTWYSYTLNLGWVAGQQPYVNELTPITDLTNFYLFKNMNLTAFKGTQVYIGYGIGGSSSAAFSEMQTQRRLYDCVTLQ